MTKQADVRTRRMARIRRSVKAAANGRARLSVHRSSKQIYAQVIDDVKGETLVAASSLEKALRSELKNGATVAAAAAVGKAIADRAKAKGITRIVFDRGGYLFHGRVKALAEAAREGGLEF
jgi:large subunit ribosomal protein L18